MHLSSQIKATSDRVNTLTTLTRRGFAIRAIVQANEWERAIKREWTMTMLAVTYILFCITRTTGDEAEPRQREELPVMCMYKGFFYLCKTKSLSSRAW
jgi:hypothetical protein